MRSTRTSTKRPRAQIRLEELETRLVPAGVEPTPYEQLMLEQLNDARSNPAAYGASIGLDLSTVAASQPLAFDPRLIAAARGHSQDMSDNNYFAHNSLNGENPGQRMADQGFPWSGWGESIAAGYTTTADALAGLIIDSGVPNLGHRHHLLAMDAIFKTQSAVGIGVVFNGSGTYSNYFTIDTATPTDTRPYLTGVVYNDLNGNGKYDVGEGLGGVTITVQGVGSTTTWASGGYSFQLSAGTYTVTASGGNLASPYSTTVSVGGQNYRLNVTGASASSQAANSTFVQNLYLGYLKRQPSPGELTTFAGQLSNGQATTASLTAMVKNSQEYANVVSVWVHQAYKDMLGRDAGSGEVANWLTWLRTTSNTLDNVAYAIVTSGEFHTHQWTGWVQDVYSTYLHRSAGSGEVAAWITHFQAGWTKDSLVSAVANSAEFQNQFANNSQFVSALYADVLGRGGSAAEVQAWVNILQSATRAQVIAGFLGSVEHQTGQVSAAVQQLYQTCLARPADTNELSALTAALNSGTPFEALEDSVLASLEYYARALKNS